MDPVSAAGFASSIITFIDFSYKIVQGSITLYSSANGVSAENAAIGTIVDDLRNVTDVIAQPPTPETDSPHWRELRKLAADCNGVSKELADVLENMKRKEGNKAWRSLEAAWKSMRKSKEIAAIEELQRQLDELKKGDAAHFDKTIDELTEIRRTISDLGTKVLAEAGQSMQVSSIEDRESADLGDLRAELALVVQSLEAIPRRTPADLLVLNRLYFGTLYARVDNIHDAEFGTFSWFLKNDEESNVDKSPEEQEDHDEVPQADGETIDEELNVDKRSLDQRELDKALETRKGFQNWLVSGSGVFHISGKAGSGKSTLMKLLGHDPEMRHRLDTWADDKKLVFASFYFWISGDAQQSSLEGLYRSLLFETLSRCPDLAKTAFPEFWREAQTYHAERSAWHQSPFRLPELRQAMKNLIHYPGHQRYRFFFFIDGLDEFQGDSNDHWELAQLLRQWTESPDVKLCVSSRPHQEFLDVFDPQQRLHLHELTRHDIRCFVSESLSKERGDHVDGVFLDEAITRITKDAQGVFLWARLVVRALLEGIRRHESPRKMKQRISQTPGDLQALFRRLIDGIASRDRQTSDQMLYIAATYPRVETLVLSWLEDLADPTFPFGSRLLRQSEEQCSRRLRAAEAQIKSLSGGLLEVQNFSVQGWPEYHQTAVFFHRTARDFLLQPDIRMAMKHRLGECFDPNEVYQRLYVAELMSTEYKSISGCLHSLRWGNLFQRKLLPQTLDAIEAELDNHTKNSFFTKARFCSWSGSAISYSIVADMPASAGNNFSLLHMLVSDGHYHCEGVDMLRKAPGIYRQQEGLCLLFSACLGFWARWSRDQTCRLVKEIHLEGERLDRSVCMRLSNPERFVFVPGWLAFLYCFGYIWRQNKKADRSVSWNVLEIVLSTLPHLDIRWEMAWTGVEEGEVE
ncbi:hypothetical protein F5X68DRAFT_147085, partial [Plectosphaerella plurivora]